LFKQNDPAACCEIIRGFLTFEQVSEYQNKCKNQADNCCKLDALYEIPQVFVDGKFHSEKMLKLMENFIDSYNVKGKQEWMPVIEKSIATCKNGSKLLKFFLKTY
jgi:hypothetical protein